jgi:hypothetical protein
VIISSPDRRYYSEATGHMNPFHLRELFCDEFRELIARFFNHSILLRQRIVNGSLIVPEGSIAGFREYRGDFEGFRGHPLPQEAVYDVIVASDEPLPDWPLLLWDGMPAFERRLVATERRAAAQPAAPSPSGSGSPLVAALPSVLGRVAREVGRVVRQVSGT